MKSNVKPMSRLSLSVVLCVSTQMALGLEPCGAPVDEVFSSAFGVGASISAGGETTYTPPDTVEILPDEHSSFLPPATEGGPYIFFEAARVGRTGAVVLQTTKFKKISLAAGYNSPVLFAPLEFDECAADVGQPADVDNEFDENYAAPGSVVQDPTLPAGNLIMIYEGENHCRSDASGVHNVQAYFATVGFARSSDTGVTWAAPSATPSTTRYPIIGGPDPKPPYDANQQMAVGDAIPSAYVEGSCLYVVYAEHPGPNNPNQQIAIQIARAQLGGTDPMAFQKYLVTAGAGAFAPPALSSAGTNIIPFTPIGTSSAGSVCTGTQYQPGLSYNDGLHRYLMTMVCEVSSISGQLAWFYSTATSLDLEDWTPPKMIANTQSLSTTPCTGDTTGVEFDGWYPSIYSMSQNPGHTSANNVAFYLDGCNFDAHRVFTSRPVTVSPDPG